MRKGHLVICICCLFVLVIVHQESNHDNVIVFRYLPESLSGSVWNTTGSKTGFHHGLTQPKEMAMLTIQLTPGQRLGNQLFLVSAAIGLAHHHHFQVVLPRSCFLWDGFTLTGIPVVNQVSMAIKIRETKHHESKYDQRVDTTLSKLKCNVTLRGYFQSWKYFHDVPWGTLKQYLTFQESVLKIASKYVIPIDGVTRVGIHVRRADIVRKPHFQMYGYTVPPSDYFLHAMDYFKRRYKNVEFYLCTDDKPWAQSELLTNSSSNVTVVDSSRYSDTDFIDLAVLSLCDHVIISTGSYGWWAGWLAGGETVYYKHWPRRGSVLEQKVNPNEYFPPHWIAME